MSCQSSPARLVHARSARGQFRAIVADDDVRATAPGAERVQRARNPCAGDRGVGDRRQAFTGEVVDHDQDAKPSGDKAIRDEVSDQR